MSFSIRSLLISQFVFLFIFLSSLLNTTFLLLKAPQIVFFSSLIIIYCLQFVGLRHLIYYYGSVVDPTVFNCFTNTHLTLPWCTFFGIFINFKSDRVCVMFPAFHIFGFGISLHIDNWSNSSYVESSNLVKHGALVF